jgi:hypothetical protein
MTLPSLRPAPVFKYSVLLCATALVACARHEVAAQALDRPASAAPQRVAIFPASSAQHVGDSLAYEHTLSVELQNDIPARLKEVRGACESRKEFACILLDVSLQARLEIPSGQVRMRLPAVGIEPMIEIASRGGRITSRSTHAEDLAEPIADTERELTLLSTHRDRLDEFLRRKDLKIEQIISLSKEISSAQTQIDMRRTQKANLQRRLDTELLTIDFSPPVGAYAAQQTPISDAIRSFGSDFRDAIAHVIRFMASLFPWLVILIPGIVLLRLFWRWITRWLVRRESHRA